MKVSYNWLKQYVDTDLSAGEAAEKLTMAGIEVKNSQVIGAEWEGIVVGQILTVNKHPNADRLTLLDIDTGTGKESVVCGAPNVAVDAKIAYAPVGTTLIDGHSGEKAVLKPAKIRGVVSNGMACSEKELGISDIHEGILILPPDAPIGKPLAEYIGDTIYNLEVTPNRPDCLSMIGLAREVAALSGTPLKLPDLDYKEDGEPIDKDVTVEIKDPDLCPRYCASLITGVKIAESPEWLKKWLVSYGMRPINNIVDITNFVMLEWGQPLHSFDYAKLEGKGIIVRRAQRGEKITSLDGIDRELPSHEMLVIADKSRAVAVAGIMGGANTEISEDTTSILLESASFKPTSIHYTGRMLGMLSEACARFERGISPDLTIPSLKRATQLIIELAGGKAAKGIIDVYPGKIERKPIRITTADVKRTLGIEFTIDEITKTLTSLGFECQSNQAASSVSVKAPYWRTDVNIPVDIIEEIVRIQGYDKIPTTLLAQPIPKQAPASITAFKRKILNIMVGYGFQEIVSYSLVGMDALTKSSAQLHKPETMPVHLANPMTSEQEYLRPDLRTNLLSVLSINKAFLEDGLRLFELGKIFIPKEASLPEEPDVLCGLIAGRRSRTSWQGESEEVDFFDAKGIVEGLLRQVDIPAKFEKSFDEKLHPANQAKITVDGKQIGVVGEVHPSVGEHFEIPVPVYLFELDLPLLLPHIGQKVFKPVPKFPAMVRDIALVVDIGVTHQQILDIITGFSLVTEVALFDVYAGDQVLAGKKSLAYHLTFQTPDRTLTDKQVNGVQQAILKKLTTELGASLRG